MSDRRWYLADALMADLTSSRYRILAISEDDAERRMSDRHPKAVAILVFEDPATWRPTAVERR
jgi:hypothetical protein